MLNCTPKPLCNSLLYNTFHHKLGLFVQSLTWTWGTYVTKPRTINCAILTHTHSMQCTAALSATARSITGTDMNLVIDAHMGSVFNYITQGCTKNRQGWKIRRASHVQIQDA